LLASFLETDRGQLKVLLRWVSPRTFSFSMDHHSDTETK
jgi:hypothetical protein